MNIAIFVAIILNLIADFIIIFSKSYVDRKGENLATKQDIGEITTEIKKVESKFDRELVHLQSMLSVSTDLFLERKTVLINFNIAIDKFFSRLIMLNGLEDIYNVDLIKEAIKAINKYEEIAEEENCRIEIYFIGEDIFSKANRLLVRNLEYAKETEDFLKKCININNYHTHAIESINGKDMKNDAINERNRTITKMHEEYRNNVESINDEIVKMKFEFKELTKYIILNPKL